MRRLFAWAIVWLLMLPVTARTATNPADIFLKAYFQIQDGDGAMQRSDWDKANRSYTDALAILKQVRTQSPEWNPHIIDFRLRYCTKQLDVLRPHLTATVPATPTVETAAPTASEAAAKKIAALTAELGAARQSITDLEKGRDELQSRLQDALKQVTPAETNLKIERLLEQNQKVAAKFAAAQQKIQELSDQAEDLQKAQEKIRDLESERDALTAKLDAAETRLETSATEHSAKLEDLVQRNDNLTAQLKEAQDQMKGAATRPSEGSPKQAAEIARLKDQLAEAIAEMDRSQQELTSTVQAMTEMRHELDEVRAENIALKKSYGDLETKLTEAESKISTMEMAGQKNDEIIVFLRKENALLKEIAENRPARRARGGFLWWGNDNVPPEPPKTAAAEPRPARLTESAQEKLVAELSAAPAATPSARPEVPQIFESKSANIQALLKEARAASELQDSATAIAKYREVLETEPDNLMALSNLGVIHYRQGDLESAETSMRRAAALAPNDAEARALLGIVYFRKGKIEEAFGELTRAIALNPRHAEAHNYLGITLSEKGWAAAAEGEIRKAIELNPQYSDAHFNLAVLYAGQKSPRYELARYHYNKALDLGAKPDAQMEQALKTAEQTSKK